MQTNTSSAPQSHSSRFLSNSSPQTGKVTTESLSAGWEKRSVREALDEVARELGVRERIYAKWVLDGKHTESDGKDRMQRMIKAASVLQLVLDDPAILGYVERAQQVACQEEAAADNKPNF